jgi:hypothetical protein
VDEGQARDQETCGEVSASAPEFRKYKGQSGATAGAGKRPAASVYDHAEVVDNAPSTPAYSGVLSVG